MKQIGGGRASTAEREDYGISRRGVVAGLLGASFASSLPASGASAQQAQRNLVAASVNVPIIKRDQDPQYDSMVAVYNRRIRATPQRVFAPRTGQETVAAVQQIIDSHERLSIISGGHCFEEFSLPKDVQSVIHVGALNHVGFNSDRQSYGVGAGARLLNVYDSLFRDHGATLPGGVCYSVGAGGHITGGGYGLLSRAHGLTVDHLIGVEVVTVDRQGKASLDYVTKESERDQADLFWAHTGGGGGNFGVVTRFDFHSEGTTKGLPSPPATVHLVNCSWPWDGVTEEQFDAFIGVFAEWCITHKVSDKTTNLIFPWLIVRHRDHGGLGMVMQVASESAIPIARQLVEDLARALHRDTRDDYVSWEQMPWMNAVRLIGTASGENHDPNRRGKQGSANLIRGLSPDQTAHLYKAMTTSIPGSVSAGMDIAALGGAIAEIENDATAVYQRNSTMKFLVQTFWKSETDDTANIDWLRNTYHGLFPEGAPTYDKNTAGSYINYPNSDLSDTRWNTSGLSAGEIYYGKNYPRLQRAKRRWDPNNIFHHTQSIQAS
ncbi:BBE domain-containing protein [Glutamicibacter sp. TV12E]|uniref:BBE domain-containing protein n=1 Tax=Glutamicibacter sp. TV12E TaxID=3446362 RepID=UPI004033D9FE